MPTQVICSVQINIKRLLESKLNRKLIKFSAPLYFGWILFIAVLTLLPGKYLSGIDWNFLSIDKAIHFTVFLILSFLGSLFFKQKNWARTLFTAVSISFLLAIAYGGLLEFSQTFIPQRGFDYADLTANISGAIMGVVLFVIASNKIEV